MNTKRLARASKLGTRFLERTPYYVNAPEGRRVRGKDFRRAMKWFRVMNKIVGRYMKAKLP